MFPVSDENIGDCPISSMGHAILSGSDVTYHHGNGYCVEPTDDCVGCETSCYSLIDAFGSIRFLEYVG